MKVIVLCGGDSSERDISIKSGSAVFDSIKNEYETVDIKTISCLDEINSAANYDVVFIALHGSFGESGEIQNRLEKLGVAYTGPDSYSSTLCFDRLKTKELFMKNGIPTPRFTSTADLKPLQNRDKIIIKPQTEGSSIGIEMTSKNELTALLKKYPHKKYIIEDFICGKELTVGFLGENLLPIIEIRYAGDFFDYNSKYISPETKYIAPAEINRTIEDRIYKYCNIIIKAFRIEHLARIDLRLDEMENPFFLEVNSIPGLTSRSLLPMAAKCCGIDYTNMCKILIDQAIKRKQEAANRTRGKQPGAAK
jgi:D-alanine-D-alanine ligase